MAEPQDPAQFKYDNNTKMWRRKTENELYGGDDFKVIAPMEHDSDLVKKDTKVEEEIK